MGRRELERSVDRKFVSACKRRGIATIKVVSVAHRGLPDRLLIGPGRRLGFVEIKSSTGENTLLQAWAQSVIEDTGTFVATCRGTAEIQSVIDRYLATPEARV